ncbi:MAG: site-specific integrase [Pseudomonadota bacterium]
MPSDKVTILGGKVHIYRRENSSFWQCSTFMAGKNRRTSTKETSLSQAKLFAEDWYLELVGKKQSGTLIEGSLFKAVAAQFLNEFRVLTDGARNKQYVAGHERRVRLYLNPYFGTTPIASVTSGMVQDYRVHRLQGFESPPSRSTLHQEMVVLRQILKVALRRGWITSLPDMSLAYRASSKISHRAWFSPEEYKRLYTHTRQRAKSALGTKNKRAAEQLHDKVLFMANTGLRPDEVKKLEYRDVEFINEDDSDLLLISVRGKRGVGYCKSMPGAVFPYKRLLERNQPQHDDLVFPTSDHKAFSRVLEELELKTDRNGNQRTWYSLRHSYISFRLLEGADIYQVAKNCRTSVEMIEKHYAVHLQNAIDASAINVRKTGKK